jgi:hypothetical protein
MEEPHTGATRTRQEKNSYTDRASTHGHEAYKKKCPGPAQRARAKERQGRKGKAGCTACMTRVVATNGQVAHGRSACQAKGGAMQRCMAGEEASNGKGMHGRTRAKD